MTTTPEPDADLPDGALTDLADLFDGAADEQAEMLRAFGLDDAADQIDLDEDNDGEDDCVGSAF